MRAESKMQWDRQAIKSSGTILHEGEQRVSFARSECAARASAGACIVHGVCHLHVVLIGLEIVRGERGRERGGGERGREREREREREIEREREQNNMLKFAYFLRRWVREIEELHVCQDCVTGRRVDKYAQACQHEIVPRETTNQISVSLRFDMSLYTQLSYVYMAALLCMQRHNRFSHTCVKLLGIWAFRASILSIHIRARRGCRARLTCSTLECSEDGSSVHCQAWTHSSMGRRHVKALKMFDS